MNTPPPRRVSNKVHELDLTGYLFWTDDQGIPDLYCPAGSDGRFLMVFSTKEKLEAHCARWNITYERIKQIDDGFVFLASLAENTHLDYRIRVAVDPYEYGDAMRYLEVCPPFINLD